VYIREGQNKAYWVKDNENGDSDVDAATIKDTGVKAFCREAGLGICGR